MITGYREFEFDLPGALLQRLVQVLDGMETAPLNVGNLAGVPEAQGIYQLFFDNTLVYIGKTDAESGLLRRLERHSTKVQHRQYLAPEHLSFKAVRIFVFTAMDLETQLIRHYSGEDGVSWNNSGFGANDPGRNRDRTVIRPGNFDARFPIDIDRELEVDLNGPLTAAAVAIRLKEVLPYTFRFETKGARSRQPHQILTQTKVSIPAANNTTRSIVTALVKQLPPGWQATAFRSHVILYYEKIDDYPDVEILGRS